MGNARKQLANRRADAQNTIMAEQFRFLKDLLWSYSTQRLFSLADGNTSRAMVWLLASDLEDRGWTLDISEEGGRLLLRLVTHRDIGRRHRWPRVVIETVAERVTVG